MFHQYHPRPCETKPNSNTSAKPNAASWLASTKSNVVFSSISPPNTPTPSLTSSNPTPSIPSLSRLTSTNPSAGPHSEPLFYEI